MSRPIFSITAPFSLAGLFIYFLFVTIVSANTIAPELVVAGNEPREEDLVGFRLRAFNDPGEQEAYVGIPNFGGGGHRVGGDLTWAEGNNQFLFTVDKAADSATLVVVNANGRYTTTYPNLSSALIAKGRVYTLNDLDTLLFHVVQRDNDGVVELYDLHLNQIDLGDYGVNQDGWNSWTLPKIGLNGDIVLTGTLYITGTFGSSAELSKFEVVFGVTDAEAECSAPEPFVASAMVSNQDTALSWPVADNYVARVWRFAAPYNQIPTETMNGLLAELAMGAAVYTDTNSLVQAGGDFYQIELIDGCGNSISDGANTFTFELIADVS